jgi:hypothetical protein
MVQVTWLNRDDYRGLASEATATTGTPSVHRKSTHSTINEKALS